MLVDVFVTLILPCIEDKETGREKRPKMTAFLLLHWFGRMFDTVTDVVAASAALSRTNVPACKVGVSQLESVLLTFAAASGIMADILAGVTRFRFRQDLDSAAYKRCCVELNSLVNFFEDAPVIILFPIVFYVFSPLGGSITGMYLCGLTPGNASSHCPCLTEYPSWMTPDVIAAWHAPRPDYGLGSCAAHSAPVNNMTFCFVDSNNCQNHQYYEIPGPAGVLMYSCSTCGVTCETLAEMTSDFPLMLLAAAGAILNLIISGIPKCLSLKHIKVLLGFTSAQDYLTQVGSGKAEPAPEMPCLRWHPLFVGWRLIDWCIRHFTGSTRRPTVMNSDTSPQTPSTSTTQERAR